MTKSYNLCTAHCWFLSGDRQWLLRLIKAVVSPPLLHEANVCGAQPPFSLYLQDSSSSAVHIGYCGKSRHCIQHAYRSITGQSLWNTVSVAKRSSLGEPRLTHCHCCSAMEHNPLSQLVLVFRRATAKNYRLYDWLPFRPVHPPLPTHRTALSEAKEPLKRAAPRACASEEITGSMRGEQKARCVTTRLPGPSHSLQKFYSG